MTLAFELVRVNDGHAQASAYGGQAERPRVDAAMIFGYKVALPVTEANIRKLEKIQKRYVRRILRLQKRSEHHILYSETGIMPIRYHLLILTL